MSNLKPISLALAIISTALILSCTSVESPSLPPPETSENGQSSSSETGEGGQSSSSATRYCVYADGGCFETYQSTCPASGELRDECPGGTSSSSSTPNNNNFEAGPVPYYGELKRSGNKLVGSKSGSPVQVRGISLGWSNSGWESDEYFNKLAVNAMVEHWKAEIIRVPIGYSEEGGYKTDPSNLARAKTAIKAAIARDVYVIIDWHSHNAHNELNAATAFFTEMAQTYGRNDHVIFEIYNEPNCSDGSSNENCAKTTWAQIKTYANTVIGAIRQHSDNLILVGTPNWDQHVDEAAADPINDNNVAYVFHFYADTHPLNDFQSKIKTVLDADLPVFVSEYGTTNADGGDYNNGNYNSHNAQSTDNWHAFMDANKISSCAWNFNSKYEGSAFFGISRGSSFTQNTTNLAATREMTASGEYIFNKLRAYANSAPWRSGWYCDYGPMTTSSTTNDGENGCFPISGPNPSPEECNVEGGPTRTCSTTGTFCDWGPKIGPEQGGCYKKEITDKQECIRWGEWLETSCPLTSLGLL